MSKEGQGWARANGENETGNEGHKREPRCARGQGVERYKGIRIWYYFGCDHTSTNAPDPIRTPQLSVLGRE